MRGLLSRLFGTKPTEPHWVEVNDLRAAIDGTEPPLVIDVRGRDEFDGPLGHIEGARNVPLPELAAQVAGLARSAVPVVCVCLTDKRSSQAAADLAAAGARDVSVLRGGMKAWRGEGGAH